jgi:hypothetical protein
LESKNGEDHRRKLFWYKNKNSLIVSVVILGLIAFVGVYFFWPHPETVETVDLVSFTCSASSGNQTFVVKVRVNLTAGMDQGAAVEVARQVFLEISKQSTEWRTPQGLYVNSNKDENGIWTVEFICFYTSLLLHEEDDSTGMNIVRESFIIIINPFDQTVVYNVSGY